MSEATMQPATHERLDSADRAPAAAWLDTVANTVDANARTEARPGAPAFMARRRRDLLSRTVAEEIVPRLVLAQRGVVAQPPVLDSAVMHDVAELAGLVLQMRFDVDSPHIARISGHRPGIESVYLDLLSPVARHLGEMWDEDFCDFTQVTVGLMRLQQILTTLSTPLAQDGRGLSKPRIMLVPGPGDQHSFGLSMVASFFQRAGWNGWSGVPVSNADLLGRVQSETFAVVGFSVSNDSRLDALAALIRAVRRASRNREVGIMVGGPAFIAHPEWVATVGADTTAVDGRQAVRQAQRLLDLIPSRG